MHFVFSYDLSIDAGSRRNEIETRIIMQLPENNYTRPLNNFFVVKIATLQEWNDILTNLSKLSHQIPEAFYFIMTPPVAESVERYNGVLPVSNWQRINELTTI